ncbi:MAG: tRNA (adenosine(37)-N6)-dimethylallyltransferase MiaA [Treponema sp.]|jgi:tRNA dimethylallyltransferase|nr:tRNA (adenosine(37)-N6)-dimethylallyltransferase MiaA [Treponema sp.]
MIQNPDGKIPVLVLFGPTASGKTEILSELFGKGRGPEAEIVSADSMQVYRGMDIGTAKPSPAEREKLPHHLIDIRDPDEQFNAGDFVRLAAAACAGVQSRGRLPVLSGGAGFYLRNFILGLPESPPSDAGIRSRIKEDLKSRGAAALFAELAAGDPVSAGRIHVNDGYRLTRALEVLRQSGRPLSSYGRNSSGDDGPFSFIILGLRRPREELYRRINERCAAMFRGGLFEEVRRLRDSGYGPGDPGLRAIGYREFFVEDGEGRFTLSENFAAVEELVARNSRRYAKRQIACFATIPGATWIDAGGSDAPDYGAAELVGRELEKRLG